MVQEDQDLVVLEMSVLDSVLATVAPTIYCMSLTHLKVHNKSLKHLDSFKTYIRPSWNTFLLDKAMKEQCVTVKDWDSAKEFAEAFHEVCKWLEAKEKAILVSWNDWPLLAHLPRQCQISKVVLPLFFQTWISVQKELEHLPAKEGIGDHDIIAALDLLVKHQILEPSCASQPKSISLNFKPRPPVLDLKIIKEQKFLVPQNYDHVLILDVEATCLKNMRIRPQEIIEISVIHVEFTTDEVGRTLSHKRDTFSHYVKPQVHSKLAPFCTALTGITQEQVNQADTFPTVFDAFIEWILEKKMNRFIMATCGDWDLSTMIPDQVKLSKMDETLIPDFLRTWINLKQFFFETTQINISRHQNDLLQMLNEFGLEFEGRLHSARDDVKTMAKLVETMAKMTVLYPTWSK